MKTESISIYTILKYLFILIIAFTIIYPMLNILAISLSDSLPIMKNEVTFTQKELTFLHIGLSFQIMICCLHIGIQLNMFYWEPVFQC